MKQQHAWRLVVGMAVWGTLAAAAHGAEQAPAATVSENMDIGMSYTLTVDGKVVDTNEGREPFHYVHGRQQIVPGLERALAGLKVGEEKDVTIEPKDGYGDVNANAYVEVAKTQLPPNVVPKAGMMLRGVNPDGQAFQATIDQVKDATVMLNLNHPLAGKTLHFKVKITGIAPAPAPAG